MWSFSLSLSLCGCFSFYQVFDFYILFVHFIFLSFSPWLFILLFSLRFFTPPLLSFLIFSSICMLFFLSPRLSLFLASLQSQKIWSWLSIYSAHGSVTMTTKLEARAPGSYFWSSAVMLDTAFSPCALCLSPSLSLSIAVSVFLSIGVSFLVTIFVAVSSVSPSVALSLCCSMSLALSLLLSVSPSIVVLSLSLFLTLSLFPPWESRVFSDCFGCLCNDFSQFSKDFLNFLKNEGFIGISTFPQCVFVCFN